jgi:general secretion pathway protein D
MLVSRPLAIFSGVLFALILVSGPLPAANKKPSSKDVAAALEAEKTNEFDKAYELIMKALAHSPNDMAIQLESRRIRFECGTAHVHHAIKLRNSGKLKAALEELEHALAIDPSLDVAEQEIRRTKAMIERNEKGPGAANAPATEEEKALTPVDLEKKHEQERIASLLPVPVLKPLSTDPIKLKMTNRPRVLFETVGKLAGINVIFDPDYETQNTIRQTTIDLENASLDEALDDLSVITKSFWKPLSPSTIFVTLDNRQKRQEYEEQVVKVFYLQNVGQQAELNEAVTVLRTVCDIQKVFTSTPMNAIIIRAEADKIPLAEKVIAAIDKPKSEVVVDVMVMEVNRNYMRNLAAAFGVPGGINSPITFTPRSSIQGVSSTSSTTGTTTTGTTSTTTTGTTGTTGATTSTNNSVLLSNFNKISTADWTVSNIPGALVEAVLSDSGTKVLQSPQIRAVDNFKATLKIGEKVPTATGSFQPGVGGVGVNPLVNTQFTYLDVGVNMDLLPRINSPTEVSMHLTVEVSQVSSYVNIGGIQQPQIGQRRVELDLRMRDGEINMIGGLIKEEDDKSISGIPGLGSIPGLRRLFTGEQITKTQQELLITLIPHIVRSPEITEADLREIATGNANSYKLNYAPQKPAAPTQTPQGQVTTPAAAGPAASAPPATAPPTPAVNPTPANPAAPVPAGGPVQVSFTPPQIDSPLASAIPVSISVANATDLAAAQAALKFDPRILRLNNVVAGEMIGRNGPQLMPSRNVLNDAGTVTASVSRDPASGGISGSGSVLTFIFQAIGRGSTTVTVPQLTLTGSTGQPITASAPSLTVNVR